MRLRKLEMDNAKAIVRNARDHYGANKYENLSHFIRSAVITAINRESKRVK